MKKIVTLQIPGNQTSCSSFELKCLGLQIKKQVEASGAKCVPIWDGAGLTLTTEGLPPAAVTALLAPFAESVRKRGGSLLIVQRTVEPSRQGGVPANFCSPGAIIRERLTRKLFFTLPKGSYVVSNICLHGHSAFAEQLGEAATRADAWKRAVACGVVQRLCQVVWTRTEFEEAACGRF